MMPSEGPALSLTEWVVLALLAEARSHGFAVARTLSRATPLGEVWTVPRPLVYRAIGRLEEHGLIAEAGEEPGDPGPRRMVYEATGKGLTAAAHWRAEPVRHLREVRSAFLAKVLLRERPVDGQRRRFRRQLGSGHLGDELRRDPGRVVRVGAVQPVDVLHQRETPGAQFVGDQEGAGVGPVRWDAPQGGRELVVVVG